MQYTREQGSRTEVFKVCVLIAAGVAVSITKVHVRSACGRVSLKKGVNSKATVTALARGCLELSTASPEPSAALVPQPGRGAKRGQTPTLLAFNQGQ